MAFGKLTWVKKDVYLQIPTLKSLIFLEQDAVAAIVCERSESSFSVTNDSKLDESIEINELGVSLELKRYRLASIYRIA